MNVRIGEAQQEIGELFLRPKVQDHRNSKDKTINGKGNQFIEFCIDENLCILNGRTEGDLDGELTFSSGVGCSVNDLCAMSCDGLELVESFQVINNLFSDHFPIKLELSFHIADHIENKMNLLPKLTWKNNKREEYQNNIRENMSTLKETKLQLEIHDLVNLITISKPTVNNFQLFKPKQKWYNNECQKARKKAFKELDIFRKNNNEESRVRYLAANNHYKRIVEQSKITYFEELAQKISLVHDSQGWWDVAREIRNSNLMIGPCISAAQFKQYFEIFFNPPLSTQHYEYASPNVEIPELDADITLEELKDMLGKLKDNKAPGEDRIPYEFIKNAPDEYLLELVQVYNIILNTGNIDESFLKSIIFPIYKKGDMNDVQNYRAIAFMNCIVKILMGIINERLTRWVENNSILTEFQAGFRKKYSTVDNIFNLTSIIHLKLAEKKKVYAFFVDFKAAFDGIPRKALIYKLYNLGVSRKIVRLIENLYSNTKAAIWTGTEFSEYFDILSGVKQGCLLSPLLFALFINDLHDELGGGLFIDDLNIRVLKYADDIVLLADDVKVLQEMIKRLQNYCEEWNMTVNTNKSKIMVFRNGGRLSAREAWTFKEEEVEIVNTYTYLGVVLTPQLSFTPHITERLIKAKTSINMTWKDFLTHKDIAMSTKFKLFCAVCRAILCYAAQVWGYAYFEEINKFLRYFLKKIFMLPDNTPTYALMLETALSQNCLYSLELHFNYIHKIMSDLTENRLPYILAHKIARKKIFYLKNWNSLGQQFGLHWTADNVNAWNSNKETLLRELNTLWSNNFRLKASQSVDRIYKHLDHSKGITYFNDNCNKTKIMWIFKCRTGTLFLNGNRFNASEEQRLCSLCNLREKEDIAHFIGRCPILKDFRKLFFNKVILNFHEIVDILNGTSDTNWDTLHNFVTKAFDYRKELVNEFNF